MKIPTKTTSYTLICLAVLGMSGCAVYPVGQPVAFGNGYPQLIDDGRNGPVNYYPAPATIQYAPQPYYVAPYYVPAIPFYGFFGYRYGGRRYHHEGNR